MDIEMTEQKPGSDGVVWDVKVVGGIVPILSGKEEDIQKAELACFLELGSIPQIPGAGVEWTAYLTGKKVFGVLDAEIRQSLQKADKSEFLPDYSIEDGGLTLKVTKELK